MLSRLLFNEPPLVIDRELAKRIGLEKAIVLTVMAELINASTHEENGKKWVAITSKELQKKVPFWSVSTVNRVLNALVDQKYLEVARNAENPYDKTRLFTIGGNV